DVVAVGHTMATGSVDDADARSAAATSGDDPLSVTARFVHLTVIRREQLRLREVEPMLVAALGLTPRRYPRPLAAAARLEVGDREGAAVHIARLRDEIGDLAVDWIYVATLALSAEVAAAAGDAPLAAACADRLAPFAGQVVVGCSG